MLQLSRRSVSMHYQAVNQRYSWQQNLMSNPTTRFDEIYNNVTPVAYTAATAQTFRIPLTALSTDLFSLQGGVLAWCFLKSLHHGSVLGKSGLLPLCRRNRRG